jgi:hypothetical protein
MSAVRNAALAAVAAVIPGASIDHDDGGDCLWVPRAAGAGIAYLSPRPRRWSYQATDHGTLITSSTLRARSAPADVAAWLAQVAA